MSAVRYNTEVLKEKNGIVYQMLQEKDLKETAALVSQVFSKGEPSVKYFGITTKEYLYVSGLYCRKSMEEGLGIIARDKENDNIIAFSISEDFDSGNPAGIEKIDEKIVIDMAIVDAIEEDILSEKKEGERRFHIFFCGTDKEYENRGIMKALIEESIKLAKKREFTSIIAEATGTVTQHIFEKFGFEQRSIIKYRDFVYCGKNIYEKIEDDPGIILMEKRIDMLE